MTPDLAAHRVFLDRYYGTTRHVYDLTRKYWLLGRDTVLAQLASEPWSTLIEIGPGTGRNLRLLHRSRPEARLGGVEPSTEMLAHARVKAGFATYVEGFAETADLRSVLGGPVDRILFSYCLSMVPDPPAALANAASALGPGGQIVVVDFGDFGGFPRPVAGVMSGFLSRFHVVAPDTFALTAAGAQLSWGPGRYWFTARISGPAAVG